MTEDPHQYNLSRGDPPKPDVSEQNPLDITAPTTNRRPIDLPDQKRREILRKRRKADQTDPFVTDPHPDVSALGRLALRMDDSDSDDGEQIDYWFALGDLSASLVLGDDARLRIFYAGKALIAYQRAYENATNDIDRTMAKRAIDNFAAWVVRIADHNPTQRNIAVALWVTAHDDEFDQQTTPNYDYHSVNSLLNVYRHNMNGTGSDIVRSSFRDSDGQGDNEADTVLDVNFDPTDLTRADHALDIEEALSDASVTRIAGQDDDLVMSSFEHDMTALANETHANQTYDGESVDIPLSEFTALEQPAEADDVVDMPRAQRVTRPERDIKSEFTIGDRILDRYEVADVRLGGMGVVYLCYDHDKREPVALKSFQKRFLDNERAVARFEKEAFTWIQLDKHPHIVQARLVQKIDNQPYILLEHVSGMEGMGADLRSWIDHSTLNAEQVMLFGIHIALGMHHATLKVPGLVHRDLKPANILVNHEGIAKVTDFGLVRSLDVDSSIREDGNTPIADLYEETERLTRYNALVGTPPYMSPEQCESNDVDFRSDVYAFGCLLYEMLTGHYVFNVRGSKNWRLAHLSRIPEFDESVADQTPDALIDLVMRCLKKDPNSRPQSWEDITNELSYMYETIVGDVPTMVEGQTMEARELMLKGYSLTELGRLQEALMAYDEALALDPTYAAAWARKARTLRLLNRDTESMACYERALNIDNQYARAWNGKGIVYLRMGQPDEALQAFEKATELKHDDIWHWYNQGDSLQKLGRYDEAIEKLDHGRKLNPKHPNTWAKLGQIYRAQGNYTASVKAYEEAIRLKPEYAWAHNGLGLALKGLGRASDAIMSFKRAIRHDPDVHWSWYNLAETLVSIGRYHEALQPAQEATRLDDRHAPSWGKLGQVYRYLKRYDDALAAYNRAIDLDPRFDWAINGKGIVLEQLQQYQAALECYQLASDIDPTPEWYWYNQANIYALLGDYEAAQSKLEKALQVNPEHERSWALMASVLRQLKQLEAALETIGRALDLAPDYAWAWNERGIILEMLNRHDDALHAFRRAHRHAPEQTSYLYKQADVLVAMGQYVEALDILTQALRLNNRSAYIWAKQGQVLRKLYRLDEALDAYTHAIELDPTYSWAWSGRGLTLSAMQRHNEALDSFKKAIDNNPSDVWYWYNYAEEWLILRQYDEALSALDEAIKLNERHPESWSKIGQVLRSLRRYDEALQAYDKAVRYNPRFAWAWNGRGLTLQEIGRNEEAIASYERAIETAPHVAWYYINEMTLLLDLGRRDEALTTIERAVTTLPDNQTVWARKGQALRRLYRFEQANDAYDRALAIDNTYAWAWNGKGLCMGALNRWTEALSCYEQAVIYDKSDVWFWHNLGEALDKNGRLSDAKEAFEQALIIAPDHEPTREKYLNLQDRLKKQGDDET